MHTRSKLCFVLFLACLWSLSPLPVNAAKFADIYMGMAYPTDQDVRIRGEVSGPDVDTTINEQFDSSFITGARFGAWFFGKPYHDGWVGFGVDVSYYKLLHETIDVEIDVVPIVAALMFRYPGKYCQPYLGIGIGLFISDANGDLSDYGLTSDLSSISLDPGWGARAGFAIPFNETMALFCEFRLDWFDQKHNDFHLFNDDTLEYDAVVRHGLVGISFRY